MSGLRYFAAERLTVEDGDGETLALLPGTIVPAEISAGWSERVLFSLVRGGKVAPIPAALAELVDEMPATRPRGRVKAAAV